MITTTFPSFFGPVFVLLGSTVKKSQSNSYLGNGRTEQHRRVVGKLLSPRRFGSLAPWSTSEFDGFLHGFFIAYSMLEARNSWDFYYTKTLFNRFFIFVQPSDQKYDFSYDLQLDVLPQMGEVL